MQLSCLSKGFVNVCIGSVACFVVELLLSFILYCLLSKCRSICHNVLYVHIWYRAGVEGTCQIEFSSEEYMFSNNLYIYIYVPTANYSVKILIRVLCIVV